MKLEIFLNTEELGCLTQNVPPTSKAGLVLNDEAKTVRLQHLHGLPTADAVIGCDETEARELLSYAIFHCPKAVQKIRDAFTKAKLTP
jgi:hypothetical protein